MRHWLTLFLLFLLAACAAVERSTPAVPPAAAPPQAPADASILLEPPAGDSVVLVPAFEGLGREGLWRQNFRLADINGDGHLDLVAPPPRSESEKPYIFLGNGKGGWREWTEARFPSLGFGYGGVDAGDIDGDGRVDLALGCHERPMAALFQVEPGVFENRSDGFPSVTQFSSRMVRLADLTGDGRPELIALNEGATYPDQQKINPLRQVVMTYKDGKWSRLQIFPGNPPPQAFGDGMVMADFDGDGRTDFATVSHVFNMKQVLFYNRVDGIFAENLPALPDLAYLFHVGTADFDRDGRPDLVYSGFVYDKSDAARKDQNKVVSATLFVAYNRKEGWTVAELSKRYEGRTKRQYRGMAVADFDGNGFPDIATVFDDGALHLLLNRDGRAFTRAGTPGWVMKGKASWAGAADLDGNGIPDLAVAYGSESTGGALRAYLLSPKQ